VLFVYFFWAGKEPVENEPTKTSMSKKSKAISIRLDGDFLEAIETAASNEKRRRGEFVRLLLEIVFERYREAGSYDALIGRKTAKVTR